jgi:hypothetical protein
MGVLAPDRSSMLFTRVRLHDVSLLLMTPESLRACRCVPAC